MFDPSALVLRLAHIVVLEIRGLDTRISKGASTFDRGDYGGAQQLFNSIHVARNGR